jgi:hypothetical protein
VRLGVLYIVQDMYSFLSEYFSTVVLAPHAIMPSGTSRVVPEAYRVVGPSTHLGSGPREVHMTPLTKHSLLC